MPKEVRPEDTARAAAYALWMKAPNPMVTFFKTLDVTNLVRLRRRRHLRFNMLMDYCVGKAAAGIPEFYTLPVGDKLLRYDALAVNTIVKNKTGEISSCDIACVEGEALDAFNARYLEAVSRTAEACRDLDLSGGHMVIGTSAIIDTVLDGAVGMNSGIFNNPFLIWGRYQRKGFRYFMTLSFQFHHTQMDGAHAGRFLEALQKTIRELK